MSPHRTSRVRVVIQLVVTTVVTAVIAAVAWVGAPAAMAADVAYPRLVAFEVQDLTAEPDVPITISYDVTSVDTLRSVAFTFSHEGRTYVAWAGTAPALRGEVELVIPDGARNGTWQLASVGLYTRNRSADSVYQRSGTISHGPVQPSETHTFDLAASDVTLTGSTEDRDYPDITSVTASTGTFTPGQQVSIDYAVADQTAVQAITVWLQEPRTGQPLVADRRAETSIPSSGSIVLSLDDTVANGTYVIEYVRVRDVMGNAAVYRADGSVVVDNGDQVIGHHDLPFAAPLFTVTGSPADYDPPELTTFTVANRNVVTGQPVSVSYAFTDQKVTLSSLVAVWRIDGVGQVVANVTDVPTSGTLVAPTSAEGVARLDFIAVGDGANSAVYQRDGTLYTGRHLRHSLDFSTRDLTIGSIPDAPTVTAVAGNGSTTVRWQAPGAHASPITAYKVTANPGGRTQTVAATGRAATFTGLANGAAHTFSVTATNGFGAGRAGVAKATPRSFVRIAGLNDWDGDWKNDLAAIDASGNLWAYKGNGRGGFQKGRLRIGTGWQATRVLTPTDGLTNWDRGVAGPNLTSIRYEGTQVKYMGTGRGKWQLTTTMPGSWSAYARVVGVGEWTEDDLGDLLTVDDAGTMRLHRASGYYAFSPGTVIGSGWGTMRQVFAVGDFSGDAHADLMAVSADGGLYLYRGNGKGGWSGSRVKVGSGWQGFRQVLSPGDFTGDDNPDVIGVKANGDMYLYRGNGRGGFSGSGTRIGTGWGAFL